jgi:anti-anti-sigma factor
MTTPPVHIERDENLRTVVAHLHGDIDSSNVSEVISPLADEPADQTLIIDLIDVQYIDSAGMAAMDTLRGRSNLHIIAPHSSIVRRALQIVGFDQLVPVVDRLEDINP